MSQRTAGGRLPRTEPSGRWTARAISGKVRTLDVLTSPDRTEVNPSAMDERFANPFAKVRRLDPDDPVDRAFILRYARHLERDPVDADHVALGVCESIREGELTLSIEDDVVVMRTAQGESVTVALADLRD